MTRRSPPAELPLTAHAAWGAYIEMMESKAAHYGYLERIERKYEGGGVRSFAEQAHLEQLLASHDSCVQVFSAAIKKLAREEPSARDILLTFMTDDGRRANSPTH